MFTIQKAPPSISACTDEVDRIAMPKPAVPVKKAGLLNSAGVKRTVSSASSRIVSAGGNAGAIDEETFVKSFTDVPTVQIFSARQLQEQMTTVHDTIADINKDWSKRTDAVSTTNINSMVRLKVIDDNAKGFDFATSPKLYFKRNTKNKSFRTSTTVFKNCIQETSKHSTF